MSLGTELPRFSIVKFGCQALRILKIVRKSRWMLEPKFDDDYRFKYLDLSRDTNAGTLGRVKFEILLTLLDDEGDEEDKQTLSGCLEEGQTTVRVGTVRDCWSIADGEKIEGCVTLHHDCFKRSKCGTRIQMKELRTSPSNLSDDLLKTNSCEFLADATLKCGFTEILVHKKILVERSPVFASKFKNKMEDSREVVEITDIKSDVLKSILKFIYYGNVDHLTRELAEDLFIAADKYQLQELKLTSAEELKRSATVDNVSRNLVLGHLISCFMSLKSHAKEIVCKYLSFLIWKIQKNGK